MDKEFFENKENCGGQSVNAKDVLKEIMSKGHDEVEAETKEMLEEISGLANFINDRFKEISEKHQALCCVGSLGLITGISFCGKPVAFAGVGTNKALSNAFKVIMMGMMTHED